MNVLIVILLNINVLKSFTVVRSVQRIWILPGNGFIYIFSCTTDLDLNLTQWHLDGKQLLKSKMIIVDWDFLSQKSTSTVSWIIKFSIGINIYKCVQLFWAGYGCNRLSKYVVWTWFCFRLESILRSIPPTTELETAPGKDKLSAPRQCVLVDVNTNCRSADNSCLYMGKKANLSPGG